MSVVTADQFEAEVARGIQHHLEEICGDDDGFTLELIAALLETAPVTLNQLKTAIDQGDIVAASRAAHGLKGISQSMGVGCLAAAAAVVETSARLGDRIAAESAASATETLWFRVHPILEQLEESIRMSRNREGEVGP
jgi:HPt (histidine-containing phosphotransfer) domain-containing protein